MILRITLSENDFIQQIEDFCLGLRDRMFAFEEDPPDKNELSVEEYSEKLFAYWDRKKSAAERRRRLMDPYKRFSKGTSDYKEVCSEVLRLWRVFAPSRGLERFIPTVSIQHELKEKWENDEVVYYFVPRDRFITQ